MERDILSSASERALHMSRAIEQLHSQLQTSPKFQEAFVHVLELLCRCRIPETGAPRIDSFAPHKTLHFVAVGKSGGVAQVLVSMLASVGINARFLHPTEALHGDLGSVVGGDPVLLVSNNGRSAELLAVLPLLRERGCDLVAVTSRPDSPLAQGCSTTLQLPVQSEACPLNQAPLTSTVTTLALGQLLVAASMERRLFDLASYARNHPGGAIGKRIFVRVEDLMVCGQFLPRVRVDATFKDVISRMTECAMGALLVVDDADSMHGFVAERDLRAAMELHGPKVFECTVHDFMNPNPITLAPGTLAVEALQLMENRPRPLNAVPIVDASGKAVGLLRLHDLVSAGITASS
ncbi:MAG: KpsF/GutQ family sugar-phosphate isomerase [Betaproteobacteria bacterium]|nr:KpsF/GutQ family sugar-phosphate isomerase [Betaproteobacteria bacterium]